MFPLLLCIYPVFETLFSIYRRKVLRGRAGRHARRRPPAQPDLPPLPALGGGRAHGARADAAQLDDVALPVDAVHVVGGPGRAVVGQHGRAGRCSSCCSASCYVMLYWRIVRFRAPRWLVIRQPDRRTGSGHGSGDNADAVNPDYRRPRRQPPAAPARFDTLPLDPKLLRAVADQGYTTMTPIQAKAIPIVLAGRDVMGAAQTGTGKTAAFSLPLLQKMLRARERQHVAGAPPGARAGARADARAGRPGRRQHQGLRASTPSCAARWSSAAST